MKIINCITILTLLFFSCSNQENYIQNVYVDVEIDLNLPEYSEIKTSGNSMFIKGGVEGIIIYHGVGNDYKIYDRNCSYEPSLICSVIDSVNSGIAYCGCCTSAFLISNNAEPINNPALLPLKSYKWSLNNNILRIFN